MGVDHLTSQDGAEVRPTGFCLLVLLDVCCSFLTWPQLWVGRGLEDCLPLATSGVCAYLRSPCLHLSTPAPSETAPPALVVRAPGGGGGEGVKRFTTLTPQGKFKG